jgi:hypothetical protein
VHAWGSNTASPHSVLRFWADAGPSLQSQWTVASTIRFELGLGILVPLRQDRFLMGPYSFHEVPPVCVRGAAAVSVPFP